MPDNLGMWIAIGIEAAVLLGGLAVVYSKVKSDLAVHSTLLTRIEQGLNGKIDAAVARGLKAHERECASFDLSTGVRRDPTEP